MLQAINRETATMPTSQESAEIEWCKSLLGPEQILKIELVAENNANAILDEEAGNRLAKVLTTVYVRRGRETR